MGNKEVAPGSDPYCSVGILEQTVRLAGGKVLAVNNLYAIAPIQDIQTLISANPNRVPFSTFDGKGRVRREFPE